LSTNAQIIALDCRDTSLVTNDNNHAYDVIVRDLAAATNDLISVHDLTLSAASANMLSSLTTLAISSNGQFVAFATAADNLVANDANPAGWIRVFFRDLAAGTNRSLSSLISGMALEPALSANGAYVAFTARSTNVFDIYATDTQSGTTTLVSASTTGSGHSSGADASSSPSISADGRYVLFQSTALDLTPGMTVRTNHYLRDLQTATTRALTTNSAKSSVASMTPDGHYIALGFSAGTPGLSLFDAQAGGYVYSNSVTGITAVSVSPDGNRLGYAMSNVLWLVDRSANTTRQIAAFFSAKRPGLKFSADGRYFAYATKPSSLVTNIDVWLYDYASDTNLLVSRSFLAGNSPGGVSDSPDLTSDGRYVAYRSDSVSIVPGDTNGLPDIFLFDRVANSTRLISTDLSGNACGNGRSLAPLFSANSWFLLFGSWAGNLVDADYNQAGDLFITGLLPFITDSDGDGMDDSWEIQYFGSLSRDGTGDFDGDGVSDLNEFLTGTDPTDPGSSFHVQIISGANPGGPVALSWPAAPNRAYRVEYKESLTDSTWISLNQGSAIFGNQGYAYDQPLSGQRFYRVSLLP
jgi:Tol biopolymer transport system component